MNYTTEELKAKISEMTIEDTIEQVAEIFRNEFDGYEMLKAELMSFGEALDLLKHGISIIKMKLHSMDNSENNLYYRIILGRLVAIRMNAEEYVIEYEPTIC